MAFDTVNHGVLLRKLEHLGIRGNLINWCKCYLTGRQQCSQANNYMSTLKSVTWGVPQGSVLGPLFFLVYINDMVSVVNNVKISLFADDRVLFAHGKNVDRCKNKLQSALNKFAGWCDRNALHINATKTKVMVFGTPGLRNPRRYSYI